MAQRPAVLDDATRDAIGRLCRQGRARVAAGDDGLALAALLEAWELLPEPKEAWAVAPAILDAVAGVLQRRAGRTDGLELLVRAEGRTAGPLATPA